MMGAGIPFACPACRTPVLQAADAYRCPACQRCYPIVLGIPDFRLFPDPYISIEEDRQKGIRLARFFDRLTFPQLVARYWEMTPGVPDDLVQEFTRSVVQKVDRSRRTRDMIASMGGPDGGTALLEIGCGAAGFLVAAAPSYSWAVGLDIGFRWLVVAKKRLQESGIENVALVCACAEHLPFSDGAFDLVASEDVLDHVRDQDGFLRESRRALRNRRSMVYLSTPNRYSLGPDPHVWVWGVGFVPPRFRDAYVRWRKGVPYGPIQPVSYLRLQRLLRDASLHPERVLMPDLSLADYGRLSLLHRIEARSYELVRRLPVAGSALRYVGPSFQVLCGPE